MRTTTAGPAAADAPLGAAVGRELRRLFGTRPRRVLALITLLIGLAAAILVTVAVPPAERTYAATAGPSQLLISVLVPFSGVLATSDLRRAMPRPRLAPRLVSALVLAAAYALFGIAVGAAAVAVVPSDAGAGRWSHAGAIALGGLLVQLIAQLTGTGLGLLLRRPGIAMAATIVLPLGLWLLLGTVDTLRPAQPWLTPFASAANLLSGQMSALTWAQSLVVALTWGLGLNLAGRARLG